MGEGHVGQSRHSIQLPTGGEAADLRVVAHEIRQPVAVLLALAEAARVVPNQSARALWYLDRIADEATVLADTVRSALEVESPPLVQAVEVAGLVEDVLATFELIWSGKASRTGIEEAYVLADPVLWRRALVNLLENATRAAGPQGRVRVDVRLVGADVRVRVEDDGPGFGAVASQSHLGMAAVRSSVAHAHGTITAGRSQDLGGAAVVLSVPATSRPAGAAHAPRAL